VIITGLQHEFDRGHDVNVHFESHHWFAVAAEWTKRMVQDGGPRRG